MSLIELLTFNKKENYMDLNEMLKEAQKLQKDMEDIQKKLETEEIPVSNDSGTITVTVTGAGKFISLAFKEEVKTKSVEELKSEILKAFQQASEMARKKHEEAMKQITASLSLPNFDDIKPTTRRTSPSSDSSNLSSGQEPPRLSV